VSSAPTVFPAGYRWGLLVTVILGFQVALAAAFDLQSALHADEPVSVSAAEAPVPGLKLSPLAQREAMLATASGFQSAVRGMGGWRIATSLLLSIAAGLVFFIGMRLRVSQDGRPSMARELGRAAVATAVLRTIDGAENLVVVRASSAELTRVLVREGFPAAELEAMTSILSAGSALWTLVIVSLFLGLSSYFRSDGLRSALERVEP
jgi:hypothetical protein